ncbi:MAG: hypothetical protein OXI61_19860, partial [Candidatus Poribacteria bacterium]|nr:hypothetical protein [Candidatus Poribacteria bacterium]
MLKGFHIVLSLLLILCFNATLMGKEGIDSYFPHTPGSFWVYVDQDGNKLTRRVVEEKTVEGETSHAFNYEPTLENLDYDYHIHPNFYQVGKEWITFLVDDDVKEAVKARLTKEVGVFRTAFLIMMASSEANLDLLYEVKVEAQDLFYMAPTSVAFNEKWDAMRIDVKIAMTPEPLIDPGEIILKFTIVET